MKKLLLLAAVFGALAQPALAQQGLTGKLHGAEALKIKANELRADNEKKTATFEGKVVAHQGDLTLYADRLVISYGESGQDLSKVEAFGHVRIVQGDREALGGHAVYDNKTARIVLDQSPKVLQGSDVITGRVITYFVDEERSEVSGGPNDPVSAVINPKGKDGGAKQ